MIKPEELRIGNYVSIDGKIVQVSSVSKTTVRNIVSPCENFERLTPIEKVEPVQLTEEILIRVGFKRKKGEFSQKTPTLTVNIRLFNGNAYSHVGSILFIVESLHLLQNLWHTISKQQLTLKEI